MIWLVCHRRTATPALRYNGMIAADDARIVPYTSGCAMKRSIRPPDLLAPAAYALLALYQPLFNAATHLVDDPYFGVTSDYYHFHWNFWWIGHALSNGLSVYETNYVFAPLTSSLALHTLSVAWTPVWAIGDAIGGTITGMNLVFLAALTLTAWAHYLLLRDLGIAPGLAFVGGAVVGFSTLMIGSIRWTNINLMGSFWLPILLLTWRRIVRAGSWRAAIGWGVALGAALWAMLLTDLQYPLLYAPVIVPYGLWTLWRARGSRLRAIAAIMIASVLAIALLTATGTLPALLAIDRTGGSPTPADRAADIKFPGCLLYNCNLDVSASALVLPVVIALIGWSLLRRRALPRTAWLWLALTAIPLSLSVGDSIAVAGSVIPMPYTLLHNAIGGIFRYPERFLPVFTLPALVFVLLTLTALTRRRPRARALIAVGLFALWLLDSQILDPLPLQPIPRDYAFYHAIGRENTDQVVVEIPTGGSSGEGYVGRPEYSALQWYGIVHGKRMVNGHISRVNTYHYFYMNTDDAMMAWLGQRRFLEPENVEAVLRERIPAWRIGYFVVHRDLIAPDQNAINEITTFFNARRDLVCPLLTEGDAVVYRTIWHPDGCPPVPLDQPAPGTYSIDIGASSDALYIGDGWDYPEALFDLDVRWTGGAESASVYVDLPPGGYRFTLRAQAYQEARVVTLTVNGQAVGEPFPVAPDGLADYAVSIPADAIADGQHVRLALTFDGAIPVGERALAVMVEHMLFSAQNP